MRIKGTTTYQKSSSKMKLVIPSLLLLGVFFLSGIVFNASSTKSDYFCDMESVSGNYFVGENAQFENGKTQSSEHKFSGRYSSKCTPTSKFGPTFSFPVQANEQYQATVWQKSENSPGELVFSGDWGEYLATTTGTKTKRGWQLLVLTIKVPSFVKDGKLKCYAYNLNKEGDVYFDDLSIQKLASEKTNSAAPAMTFEPAKIDLQIEETSYKKLTDKRQSAFATGNLIAGKEDLVPAKLRSEQADINVDIRLKGDLLDHLRSKKWSFRILPEKGKSWKEMVEFSVHNSASRSHLNEWVFHQLLFREEVLTTQYDFIDFYINKEFLGVYAYEEHFGGTVLKNNERPPGPIIRINEDGLWNNTQKRLRGDQLHWYESALIEPFDKEAILSSENLKEQFLIAQNLLFDFKNGNKKVSAVFDIEKLGKFYALVDLSIAFHATNSTNLRFYFNPSTGLLEPVGYDGYTDDGTGGFGLPSMIGQGFNQQIPKSEYAIKNNHFFYYLMSDMEFMAVYAKYLEQFTNKKYLEKIVEDLTLEAQERAKFIGKDYQGYAFDLNHFLRNGPKIQTVLYPIEEVSLRAYYLERSSGLSTIVLESFHKLPLEVLGTGEIEMIYSLTTPKILEAYNSDYPVTRDTVQVTGKNKHLFFKTLGTDSIVHIPITKWAPPTPLAARKNPDINTLTNFDFITIHEQTIRIQRGNHELDNSLIIPNGYKVKMEAGCVLKLTNNASIISYSPIFALGTSDLPIHIYAKEGRGQGVAVIGTSGKSEFRHVVFQGLKSVRQGGQFFDGAVNFYEADVAFNYCSFKDLFTKDGLSMVRSKMTMRNSNFATCSGDAIDADYSTSTLVDNQFDQIGKDAIEVSGGKLTLMNNTVQKCMNAAITANQKAIVRGMGIQQIINSKKGVQALDNSVVSIENIELTNVDQGFLVFKKDPSYEPGKLTIVQHKSTDVRKLYALEKGGILSLNGKNVVE